MKIISFNIGIKIDNADKVIEYLRSADADIVCLQEALRPLDKKVLPLYRSVEAILNSLGGLYPHYFFAPEWVADRFERDGAVYRDLGGCAEQGKLILSKYPIVRGYNYFYYKTYEFDRSRTKFEEGNDHGRALQVCDINVDGKIIQLGNVHGAYSADKKDTKISVVQSNFVVAKLKERNLPAILLGDFNLHPDTESVAIIEKSYSNNNKIFNISSTRPNGQAIDYLFTDDSIEVKSLAVDATDISDHYPLIAELKLK